MRLVIITPRLPAASWSISPIVVAILRGLRVRGHTITLLADSIEDADQFSGATIHAFREFSQTSTDFPVGFGRWARAVVSRETLDASLSLTRRAHADLLFPLDPTPRAWLVQHGRTQRPLGFAAHLAKHRNVGVALAASIAGGRAQLTARGARLLTLGPLAHLYAARSLGLHPESARLVNLPRFSLLAPASAAEREQQRRSLRAVFGLSPERTLLLLSAPDSFGGLLRPMLSAIAQLHQFDPDTAPHMLVFARDTFSLLKAACLARDIDSGPPPWLHVLTPTHNIRPALLAADYAVAPFAAPVRNQSAAAVLGRLITDALWVGTPVLALHTAPGADLIAPTAARSPTPGWIVRGNTREGWLNTLQHAMNQEALEAARSTVDRAALSLSFGEALDIMEEALMNVDRE